MQLRGQLRGSLNSNIYTRFLLLNPVEDGVEWRLPVEISHKGLSDVLAKWGELLWLLCKQQVVSAQRVWHFTSTSVSPPGKRRLARCSNPLISDFTHRRTRKRSLRHLQLILRSLIPTFTAPQISNPPIPIPIHPAGLDVTQGSWGLGTMLPSCFLLILFVLEGFFFCLDLHSREDLCLDFTVCIFFSPCLSCLFVFLLLSWIPTVRSQPDGRSHKTHSHYLWLKFQHSRCFLVYSSCGQMLLIHL